MAFTIASLLLGIGKAMSDLSDYAAMVIRHNRLIGGKQGLPRARRYVLQLSAIVTWFSDAQTS
jgi:hypothetical protein